MGNSVGSILFIYMRKKKNNKYVWRTKFGLIGRFSLPVPVRYRPELLFDRPPLAIRESRVLKMMNLGGGGGGGGGGGIVIGGGGQLRGAPPGPMVINTYSMGGYSYGVNEQAKQEKDAALLDRLARWKVK